VTEGGAGSPGTGSPSAVEGLFFAGCCYALFVALGALAAWEKEPGRIDLALLQAATLLLPTILWARLGGFTREALPARPLSLPSLFESTAAAASASLAALAAGVLLVGLLGTRPEDEIMGRYILDTPPAARFLLFALVPACCEEVLFRGGVLHAMRRWGTTAACLANGAAFAAFHGSLIRFLPMWILGSGLAFIVRRTGNLYLAVVFHLLHNALILLAMGQAASMG